MSGDDERGIVPVLNPSRSTVKIDSLSIKLGIMKGKDDTSKCRHFSIRGFVAGMREKGRCNLLSFTEELPPMEIPNFRYWLCQKCLENDQTANGSNETPLVSGCDQCVFPFGEGTSGLERVNTKNDDETIFAPLRPDKSQTCQEIPAKKEIPAKVKVCQQTVGTIAGEKGSNELKDDENYQEMAIVRRTISPTIEYGQQNDNYSYGLIPMRKALKDDENSQEIRIVRRDISSQEIGIVRRTISPTIESGQQNDNYGYGLVTFRKALKDDENSQEIGIVRGNISSPEIGIVRRTISPTIESGQQKDNYPYGLIPMRKSRKVRLLKEILFGHDESELQKYENASFEVKRKMLHDPHHDHHDDYHHDHKKMKTFKEDAILKTHRVEPEHPRNVGAGELEEDINKYEWNKHGTERSSILGKVNSDAVTAWRSIFSDTGRPDNRVPPAHGVAKSRGPEPYSNLMNPPKSDKKVNSSMKITVNRIERNFSVEASRRMKDSNRSHAELGLNLSLNNDVQSRIRSQPSVLSQPPSQDYYRNSSFFLGESSNFPHRIIPSNSIPKERSAQEKQLYTQLPCDSCFGHQKLDFSDPYKKNTGMKGYSEFTSPNNYQRQEGMFSIGRSDEREIIELLAKNQHERNLSHANNEMMTSFHKLNAYEETRPWQHEYFTMNDNVGPMRNPAGSFFQEDQIPSFTANQKKPLHGVWISDPKSQRRYDSHYPYASNGSYKRPQTHLYNPASMQVLEGFNKYTNGGNQNKAAGMQSGQTYAKYPEKDKGKNPMDLDLNLVAPNAFEEQNNSEPLDLNPKRMRSFDSSYSNETIPAMQLLSLMDAGKSSQPFSLTGQPLITKPKPKPVSICYSHSSSTVNEKTNPLVNPMGSSSFSMFPTCQNNKLTSNHGQLQVYHKPQEKSRGASLASVGCRPEASHVFPLPWHATDGQNKPVNRAFGSRIDSSRTEVCTINQNPADFSTPGPDNVYMISIEDLVSTQGRSYKDAYTSQNAFGPKTQKKVRKLHLQPV